MTLRLTAPAKINLSLNITGRRDNDGYHLLDSVMVFTAWGDEITLHPAKSLTFTVDGPYATIFDDTLRATDHTSPNLIVQAAYMMAEKAGRAPNIHIHLTKNIPAGAGLGGGSSDAAAVMNGLNDLWDMGLSRAALCQMGLRLGAELPVCLHAPSACRVTGIGDYIEALSPLPSYHLVITWPDQSLATQHVFDVYRQGDFALTPADKDWIKSGNDLTATAITLCPNIGELLSDLWDCEGCILSRMSGSGSACFGIFSTADQAQAAASRFKNAIVTTTHSPA